jgi:hypothetical protein
MPTHQQLYELYYQGDEATIRYIEDLQSHIDNQAQLLGHQQRMTINLLVRAYRKDCPKLNFDHCPIFLTPCSRENTTPRTYFFIMPVVFNFKIAGHKRLLS